MAIVYVSFGLCKILGPGETCCESYGTPGYAAPEVINEEIYWALSTSIPKPRQAVRIALLDFSNFGTFTWH